jgi:hypothetical protein
MREDDGNYENVVDESGERAHVKSRTKEVGTKLYMSPEQVSLEQTI